MNNKSILHVVNIYFVLPYFIGEQFLYFAKRGYKLYVVCSPSEQLESYSKSNRFSYLAIPILRSFSVLQDLKSIFSICRYVKENKIDIVCGHTPKGALLSMVAAYIMQVPTRIYFRHGLVYETSHGIKRKILVYMDKLTSRLATKIVCVSPSVCQRSLVDKLNSEEKQTLLSKGTCNGVNIDKFSRSAISSIKQNNLKEQVGIAPDGYVIGYTGRLVRDKGIIELINAFDLLTRKYDNIYLLLVGMLEDRDALPSSVIERINDNSKIINTGFVENDLMPYYYSMMDLFCLPSYREGFPTSVLEASAMELPVITTRVTGCIDSIIENTTGIFVNHDAVEIANAIQTFINDKDKQVLFGQAGREFVSTHFDQKIIWKHIEELYK